MKFRHVGAALAACSILMCAGVSSADTARVVSGVPGNILGTRIGSATACAPGSTMTLTWPGNTATVCGAYSDIDNVQDVYVYKGIEYGVAGRWQDPSLVLPLPHQDALKFGPACPQQQQHYTGDTPLAMDEHCLYLNIWRAKDLDPKKRYPVMVFIHGGAFVTGAGSDRIFDGTNFARHHVILVTLNYRLGALGFLAANAHNVSAHGNYGLRDQIIALAWVNRYIDAFGGDPSNVTLFGESAGAMSVGLHLFSVPASAPYFKKAIMQSNVGGSLYKDENTMEDQGGKFLTWLCKHHDVSARKQHCDDGLGWLDKIDPADILNAQDNIRHWNPVDPNKRMIENNTLTWSPVVDLNIAHPVVRGEPKNGYASGTDPKKRFAMGVNQDEGAMFVAMAADESNKDNPQAWPTKFVYGLYLVAKYGHIGKIIDTDPRYKAETFENKSFPGFAYSGQALSNTETDDLFTCQGLLMAENALAANNTPSVYYFSQPVFFNLLRLEARQDGPPADNGACDPKQSPTVTCHATELPYVFNTVTSIEATYPFYRSSQADRDLAVVMNRAWAEFAIDPDSPEARKDWLPYNTANGKTAYRWEAGRVGDRIDLDKVFNCSSLWTRAKAH